MPRSRVRQDQYDRMLAAYRAGTTAATQLAKIGGVNRKTATRGLEEGWPPYFLSFPKVIEYEREKARARSAADLAALAVNDKAITVQALAQDEAITVLAEEARLLRLARQDVGSVLAVASEMLPAVRAIALDLRNAVAEIIGAKKHLSPKDSMELIKRYSEVIKSGADAAALLVQTERLKKGDPNDTINRIEDISEDEAFQQLEDVARRYEELKARPNLKIIEGGRRAPDDGAA